MLDLLLWLLAIEFLGLLSFPLCFRLLHRLPDRGFAVAKPFSLVLCSYAIWVLGLTHLVPSARYTILGIVLILGFASWWVIKDRWRELASFVKQHWPALAAAEVLFLGFFLLWAGITSESPAINHTEKPMDLALFNASLHSRFFPPEDPWLAGHSISYYYFGHFIMALLAKLTSIPSSVAYNLALASVPALLASASFGLLYNLIRLSGAGVRRATLYALAAPLLIILAGNLEGVMEFVWAQGWGSAAFWEWVGIKGLEGSPTGTGAFFPQENWWWWRATRVIDTIAGGQSLDYTITEFPFFSFLLGDLHAHVLSLPFMVLALYLCLNLMLYKEQPALTWLKRHPLEAAALAMFIGSLAFINTWDFVTVAFFLALVFMVKWCVPGCRRGLRGAGRAIFVFASILAIGVALFLPFYLTFSTQAKGVLPLLEHGTRPFHFLLVMGLFSLLGVSFLLRQLPVLGLHDREQRPLLLAVVLTMLLPFAIWVMAAPIAARIVDGSFSTASILHRAGWALPALAVAALACYSLARCARSGDDPGRVFTLGLLLTGFLLLAGAELFYVADAFGGGLRRMNTVFKVYYQAWLLLGLAGGYAIFYWASRPMRFPQPGAVLSSSWMKAGGHRLWLLLVAVLVAAALYYPAGAALDRTGLLREGHSFEANTLDGLAFIKGERPGEYAAIGWLRDVAPWGRIVEAVGDDYTEYGRISSSTGRATVLGWPSHELQWRGSSQLFEGRADDVETIYRSSDHGQVRELLDLYGVRYVYQGHRETESYGWENLENHGFLKPVFTSHDVTIYEYEQ